MHLTALVDGPDHVCCRYRLAAFRPVLEAAGHTLEVVPWPKSWWRRLRIGDTVRSADAVVLQRRLLPLWQLYLLRRAAQRLLFDFDDALFLRDSYASRGLHSGRRRRRFRAVVRAADGVVAGNDFLAEHARRQGGPDNVVVIPTCVDPARYPVADHARTAGVQLVWVGSSSTLRGLEAVRPLLESLGSAVPGLRLKLICDRFMTLDRLPVDACPWTEEDEAAEIAAADVGLSWVPDDLWSRGKCGLKVLQYMAAGLPVVANPVGVQSELVRHGVSGFLADTAEKWVNAVARLARDPGLRRQMGQAGRRRVEEEFCVARGAERWLALLDALQDRRQVA